MIEETERNCIKCGDKLTGHEDDSATHCRWCVTCVSVEEDNAFENTQATSSNND